MSGRGVITSRTSVSPKSTMLCSSRRSSPSMRPSCSAVSMYALATSFASSAASSGVGGARWRGARWRWRRRADASADSSTRATGANDGSSSSSTRSGSRPTITSGRSSSTDDDECHRACDDERQRVGAVDADFARQQRGRGAGDEAEQQAHRNEQQQRIVEVVAERVRPRPLRSATRRSDSRISALNAASIAPRYTAAHASRKMTSGVMPAGRAAAQPRHARSAPRAGRPSAAAAARRAASARRRARDRSRAGAAVRAAPARAARSAREWPASRAWRRATPRAITMSPRKGCGGSGTRDSARSCGRRPASVVGASTAGKLTARRSRSPCAGTCGSARGCARR